MRPEEKRPMVNAVFARAGVNWRGHLEEVTKKWGAEKLETMLLEGKPIKTKKQTHGLRRFFGLAVFFNYEVNDKTYSVSAYEYNTLTGGRTGTFKSEQLGYDLHISDVEILKARKAAVGVMKNFNACNFKLTDELGECGDSNVFFFKESLFPDTKIAENHIQ